MTQDLKKNWLNVARRMQSVAKSEGLQLITITVLADKNGEPRFWTEPSTKKIEPRSNWRDILELLSQEVGE